MVLPRNEETVTRRFLAISQYVSPLVSTWALSALVLAFLDLGSGPLPAWVSEVRFREVMVGYGEEEKRKRSERLVDLHGRL